MPPERHPLRSPHGPMASRSLAASPALQAAAFLAAFLLTLLLGRQLGNAAAAAGAERARAAVRAGLQGGRGGGGVVEARIQAQSATADWKIVGVAGAGRYVRPPSVPTRPPSHPPPTALPARRPQPKAVTPPYRPPAPGAGAGGRCAPQPHTECAVVRRRGGGDGAGAIGRAHPLTPPTPSPPSRQLLGRPSGGGAPPGGAYRGRVLRRVRRSGSRPGPAPRCSMPISPTPPPRSRRCRPSRPRRGRSACW